MIPKSKLKEMIAFLEKEAVHGWKAELARSAGVTPGAVTNAIKIKSPGYRLAQAIIDMYDEYKETERQINGG